MHEKSGKFHIPRLRYRYKIFTYFLAPILLTGVVSICMNQYYLWYLQQKTETGYIKTLSSISETVDNSLYELFRTTILLSSSNDLKDVIYSDDVLKTVDYAKVSQIVSLLSKFRSTKHYIENVFILHRPDDLIMASDGTASADEFFNSRCLYEKYDRGFWTGITSEGRQYRTLETSTVENVFMSARTSVIPIVQFGIGDSSSKNLFVINLREDYISGLLRQNRLTLNSRLYVLSKESKIISQSNPIEFAGKSDDLTSELTVELKRADSPVFVTRLFGQKSLVVTYTANENALSNFTYVAVVPYGDLIKESTTTRTLPILIIVSSLVLGVIISFIMSNKLYNPIGRLASFLMENNGGPDKIKPAVDEFTYINSEIKDIISSNERLAKDLSLALPYVCEQYLFKILNDNELYLDEEIKDFLFKYGFSFRHNYYAVVITGLGYTRPFYEKYSSEEQLALYREMAKVMKIVFPLEYQTYVLAADKKKLYVIVNLPEEDCESSILEAVQQFHENLNIDEKLLRVYSGVGKVHKQLSGLQQSYKEAEGAISQLTPMDQKSIKLYEKVDSISKFSYSIQEENKLFNYLVRGDKEKANDLLSEIIKRNISGSISDAYLKELYIQIHNTGIRALSLRNIQTSKLIGPAYMDIINRGNDIPSKEMGDYVCMFLERIANLNASVAGKIDLDEIRQYIDENYTKDIYLDQLADKYKITAKYMSKLLKEALGIPFQQYLSNLRIDKAKEFLSRSKMNITDIALGVGFNSRNTFIRMFNKLEGITPSEYRNLARSNKP